MFAYLIPTLIISSIIYSIFKKKSAYNIFVSGAKTSFDLMLTTLPYLVAILIVLEVYFQSGLNKIIGEFLTPFFSFCGIPKELNELVIIKNFSGSGSLAMLENIFTNFGADSYIGRSASCIMGSSEAIFFVSSIYLSKCSVKKVFPAIIFAIMINFFSAILSCFLCKII